MDVHCAEAAAACAAVGEFYGSASPGNCDGQRRRWEENDPVLFYYQGQVSRGCVMQCDYGVERDTYLVRRHVVGGGTEIVEVRDRAMLVY
jgi:hypothetical protein